MDSISLSQSVSKEFGNEKTSMSELYFGDLDIRIDAITTEVIEKGNTILDTYEVLSDAVYGGMGSVWRVHHNSWNTDLAMKRPQPRFFTEGGDKRKEQFIKECENWINLGLHPNIVSCYYVRELGGVPTIFSEWMDGGSLKDRIADGSLYQGSEQEVQERILDIAIQAARGLQYSHENGLIHQDMKPGNLLLTKDWEAKVADFGLAKAKSNLSESDTAKSSGYTIAYCPKEQSDGEEPQRWMDVYAWALTVLEMYAGKRLWETGADAKEHIEEYPSQCAQKLPDEMRELLRLCLNDKPDGFDAILQKAEQSYRQANGRSYGRERFDSKTTSVDNLNNYALSMLDLGLGSEALNTWDKLLAAHPDHVQSIINRAFYLWRCAKIKDVRVESTLESLPNSEEKAEAMELFRLERGDLMETGEGLVSSGKNYHGTKEALFDTNDTLLTVKAYVNQPRNMQQVMQNITSGRPAKTHHKLSRVRFKTGESHDVSLRETELLTLTRDRKKAIAGRTNRLFLIDFENGDQTADITIDMTDDQRYQAYPEHNDMWASAPSVTMYNIKFEDRSDSGRGVIRKQQKPKWESIWLEENDTVLCVVERTCWEKASDVAEYRKWEKKRKGQPPKVNYTHADHLLRFSLDENLRARLIEIKKVAFNRTDLLKPLLQHEGSFERGSADKKDGENKAVVEKKTGRVFKTLSSPISDFTPDGEYYCSAGSVYKVPADIAKSRLYQLSRIKNISTVISEEERAEMLSADFDDALFSKNYQRAIEAFSAYREMPDRLDTQKTIGMELKLSSVCVKKRLHHFAAPSSKEMGFDMTPFDNGWIHTNYNYYVDKSEWRTEGFQRGGIRRIPYKAPAEKALTIIQDHMPFEYIDDDGKKQTLDLCGKVIHVSVMNYDMTVAFVRVSNNKEKYEVLLRVDIEDENAQVVSTRGGDPIVAPDGLTWANTLYSEKESIRVNEDEAEGYCIGVPDRVSSGRFSPDSRFILADFYNKNSQSGNRSIIGIIPESFDSQPYHVPITEFPPASLPKGPVPGLSNGEVFFSADGMHLICVRYNQFKEGEYEGDFLQEAIPYLRLSWDYELPVPKNEHERYNKYSGQKKKPIKPWDPSKKVLLKKEPASVKKDDTTKPGITIDISGKNQHIFGKRSSGCIFSIVFYVLLITSLVGLILNIVRAGNISSVIDSGKSVIGTAVRDSDFFLFPSVTLEYSVDGEQFEVKNTTRFDKINTDGAEDDNDRRKVEIFYESDHPEKAYTRDTLALAELRRTIFLIVFIVLEVLRLIVFLRFRKRNKTKRL